MPCWATPITAGSSTSSAASQAFKPYIKELTSPKGVNPLRDNIPDHIHHHGLMFAVAVDDVNFWAEYKNCGREDWR